MYNLKLLINIYHYYYYMLYTAYNIQHICICCDRLLRKYETCSYNIGMIYAL